MAVEKQGRILVAGAGFSGAVIARELAEAGYAVEVFDSRKHLAGNCHTERDAETGVLVHRYGPHIFHTADAEVWQYVNRYDEFLPFVNRVKAVVQGRVYSLPVNLHTINQLFGRCMGPAEAEAFVASLADRSIVDPQSFEEQALRFLGRELYTAFFRGYTLKQWGRDPRDLPASILKRLPVRFNYDDNYFNHPFQGMPRHGYTKIVAGILDHPLIRVHLGRRLAGDEAGAGDHLFWTGPLDDYFGCRLARLAYRTLDFERFVADGDYQGNAVINYCDEAVPYTRITEHKHFSPWEQHARTVCFRETSRECGPDDIPYYPVRLVADKELLAGYVGLAEQTAGVTFAGRLATYRYLDMDVTIREALDCARAFLRARQQAAPPPRFSVPPL